MGRSPARTPQEWVADCGSGSGQRTVDDGQQAAECRRRERTAGTATDAEGFTVDIGRWMSGGGRQMLDGWMVVAGRRTVKGGPRTAYCRRGGHRTADGWANGGDSDGCQTVYGGQWTVDVRRRTADAGWMDGGRWSVDGGRWRAEGGPRTAYCRQGGHRTAVGAGSSISPVYQQWQRAGFYRLWRLVSSYRPGRSAILTVVLIVAVGRGWGLGAALTALSEKGADSSGSRRLRMFDDVLKAMMCTSANDDCVRRNPIG